MLAPVPVLPVMSDRDFEVALIKLTGLLRAHARRLAGPGADADDLLQDTMLRCWSARASFVAGTNLPAWVRVVMTNSFLSGRRRARFYADLPEEARDRMLSVEENQSLALALRDADWALGELASHHRDAVLLASQGVSIADGATRLGIPEGTFKSRLARGRIRLRALINERATPLLADKSEKDNVTPETVHSDRRKKRNWRGVMIG